MARRTRNTNTNTMNTTQQSNRATEAHRETRERLGHTGPRDRANEAFRAATAALQAMLRTARTGRDGTRRDWIRFETVSPREKKKAGRTVLGSSTGMHRTPASAGQGHSPPAVEISGEAAAARRREEARRDHSVETALRRMAAQQPTTIQYNTIQYNTIQYNTIKHTTQKSRPSLVCATLHAANANLPGGGDSIPPLLLPEGSRNALETFRVRACHRFYTAVLVERENKPCGSGESPALVAVVFWRPAVLFPSLRSP